MQLLLNFLCFKNNAREDSIRLAGVFYETQKGERKPKPIIRGFCFLALSPFS